ncbi:DUF3515 domain-containing protein [Pseudoclavibacter soli]|uniref:DUF3515 domain-containing protein n=1 Tax=Pseudoclavibacter soli TaxID=452623 RepID=UPI00042954E3|nr:DUF3515 domain-containing protein [Pseudoclavibacter soli]
MSLSYPDESSAAVCDRPVHALRTRRLRSAALTALLVGLTAPLLSGCSGTVSMTAAPDADDPACAEITVRLPETLSELPKRKTNAQATGAWGDPAAVVLRCGVRVPEVSDSTCVTVGDIDWLVDDTDAPTYRFTTYGRTPATEVLINSESASGNAALAELANIVARIPADKRCQ